MGPVLALQAIEGREAVFDFGQVLGRGLDAAGVIAQGGADVLHADAGGLDRRQRLLEFRFVADNSSMCFCAARSEDEVEALPS